jgi:hypothetical protein
VAYRACIYRDETFWHWFILILSFHNDFRLMWTYKLKRMTRACTGCWAIFHVMTHFHFSNAIISLSKFKQDRQRAYHITLWRIRVMEKQHWVLCVIPCPIYLQAAVVYLIKGTVLPLLYKTNTTFFTWKANWISLNLSMSWLLRDIIKQNFTRYWKYYFNHLR